MGWFDPKGKCLDCGAEFSPESVIAQRAYCPECEPRHADEMKRQLQGCLLAMPAGIAAAACCGFLGFHLGRLLAVAVPLPDLAPVVAFIAGADGMGIVFISFGRKFGFIDSKLTSTTGRLTALAAFAVVAAKCARGMRIEVLFWIAIINLVCMLPITFWLFPSRAKIAENDSEEMQDGGLQSD